MLSRATLLAAISLLLSPISSSPLSPQARSPAASAHNIYLLTCTPYNTRGQASTSRVTGIAFFTAPVSSTPAPSNPSPGDQFWNSLPRPDASAIISDPATTLEGYKLQIAVWNNTLFSSEISAGASKNAKGAMVGKASLGQEDFVCFRDGETGIALGEDDDGGNGNGGGRGNWGPGWWGPGRNGGGNWNGGWRGGGGRRPPNGGQTQDGLAGAAWVGCTADYWCASVE